MNAKRLIESLEAAISKNNDFFTYEEAEELLELISAWIPRFSVDFIIASHTLKNSYKVYMCSPTGESAIIVPGTASIYGGKSSKVVNRNSAVKNQSGPLNFKELSSKSVVKKFSTVEQLLEIISQEFGL